MIDLLKAIIEKGGNFGIINVVIIVIISFIVNLTKYGKINTYSTLRDLRQFLKVFFIVSMMYLVFLEVYRKYSPSEGQNLVTPIDSVKYEPKRAKIRFRYYCLDHRINEKEFNLTDSVKMLFTNNGQFILVKKDNFFQGSLVENKPLIITKISDIEYANFYEYERLVLLSFKNNAATYKLNYNPTRFRKIEFIYFVNDLNEMGFYINQDFSKIYITSIIGIIFIIFLIVAFFLMGIYGAVNERGWLVYLIILLLCLFSMNYLRSCA
jgi:hypothetical protein